ncbi:YihY/virulence factor BrkB family protein [Massilia soli]|uniref:YihY/virulence factor BrkB family protein n=1 Tax=Massilia soli TaxID=2792854 RepID=A0ABS7SV26_9BURK|nr:YihY/virulence factor BrkB family protein [Massilia soli]MBZ2209762.1 YihY/virulence factor BrkB family protein [Massilia soli]
MQVFGKSTVSGSLFVLIKRSLQAYMRHDMPVHAAALSFRMLFSMFPFVIFLLALLGFFRLPAFFGWLREQAGPFLPQQALHQVDAILVELQVPQKGLLSFGAVVALWLASGAMRSLMKALNVAYAAKESRPAWKRYPLSILFTVGIALMLTVAAILMHFGPQAMRWLAGQIGLEASFVTLWAWLRWPVALMLSSLSVAIAYHFAPNVAHPFRLVSAGSLLSVLVWSVASLGFSFYVQNFANYDVMFGSIGAVIVLLAYIHISMSVLLFGAEVNAAIEQADSSAGGSLRAGSGAGHSPASTAARAGWN